MNKELTVIMSVYNEEDENLKKAIESILNQTYTDFIFIIIDDGTSISNKKILKYYKEKDKRIEVIVNEKNLGLVKSLNRAIEITNTKYIARMDSNDISHIDRLEKQINFMENNEQYVVIGTRANYCNEKGIYLVSKLHGEVTRDILVRFCAFFHPTIMIRADILKRIGEYENYLRNEDYALYLKMYSLGYKGYIMDEALLDYRQCREDFNKRKYKHRIIEAKVRKKYFKLLKVGIVKRTIYTIKPLIVGLIPKQLLYQYKKRRNIR